MGEKKNIAKPSAGNGSSAAGLWLPESLIRQVDVSVVPAPTTLRGALRELFRAWGRFWRYLWAKRVSEDALSVVERDELKWIVTDIFGNDLKHGENEGK